MARRWQQRECPVAPVIFWGDDYPRIQMQYAPWVEPLVMRLLARHRLGPLPEPEQPPFMQSRAWSTYLQAFQSVRLVHNEQVIATVSETMRAELAAAQEPSHGT